MAMVIKRITIPACCSKPASHLFELEIPVTNEHLLFFLNNGYTTLDTYTRVNVFYVEKQGLTARAPFGGKKVQITTKVPNSKVQLDDLANMFELALSK